MFYEHKAAEGGGFKVDGYDCHNCMDQGCGCCENAEQVAMDDELGAAMGDPRRCPHHPHVAISSPDGMFDAPCGECEYESDQAAVLWNHDPENPFRQFCGLDEEAPSCGVPWRKDVGCADSPDDFPF